MIPGAFAAIIGFITYFIVFNLNLLISGLRRLLTGPRNFLLEKMANENGSMNDSMNDSSDDPTNYPLISSILSAIIRFVRNLIRVDSKTTRKSKDDGKRSTDWATIAKAFEVFPREDEGPRPTNWLLLFYAIRLLIIKVFDLVIGVLEWLRETIASNPSNQVSRSSV
jgi:hypothetical protein